MTATNLNIRYDKTEKKTVNHPEHYKQFPVEVIEIIKFALGPEGFKSYCLGNEIKYRLRAGFKGDAMEDFDKALKYRDFIK